MIMQNLQTTVCFYQIKFFSMKIFMLFSISKTRTIALVNPFLDFTLNTMD